MDELLVIKAVPKGFLLPDQLVSICGSKQIVDELVKDSMIYFRTLSNSILQEDLDSMVSRYKGTIYTALGVADLHVMKVLLEKDYKFDGRLDNE